MQRKSQHVVVNISNNSSSSSSSYNNNNEFSTMKQIRPSSIIRRCWINYRYIFVFIMIIIIIYTMRHDRSSVNDDESDNDNKQVPIAVVMKTNTPPDQPPPPQQQEQEQATLSAADSMKLLIKKQEEKVKLKQQQQQPPAPPPPPPPKADPRQKKVVEMFRRSFDAYKKYAWGSDVLCPLTKRGASEFGSGLGLTLIDALDTAYIMGLNEYVEAGREWIKNSWDLDQKHSVNLFETTIRLVGGLLSMFALSGDALYRDKAQLLADKLMGAFSASKTVIPVSDVYLETGRGKNIAGKSSTSEVSTIQLEYRYLSYITGNNIYKENVDKVMVKMRELPKFDGLVDIFMDPNSAGFSGGGIRLGSRGDSYYEYLLKQYLQTNRTEALFLDDYTKAMNGVNEHLVGHTPNDNLTFIGELPSGRSSQLSGKMDHLVCFLPGTLALGATISHELPITDRSILTSVQARDLKLAEELTYACWQTYARTPTGLAAEISHFSLSTNGVNDQSNIIHDKSISVHSSASHNILRPETVETLYYMYHITNDEKYRTWGYAILQSFEKYASVPGDAGYASLMNVASTEIGRGNKRDKMESFFLAETLKYLYLLFENKNPFDFKQWVFNTEAHPLPVFQYKNDDNIKL